MCHFSIRDLLWLTFAVALGLGCWLRECRLHQRLVAEMDQGKAWRLRAYDVEFSRLDRRIRDQLAQANDEGPTTESDKIEALIKHIEELSDAKFVRNGSEYEAKTAAKFLRGKWDAKKDEIKTAEDFIAKVASVSSTSGKPYLIRFKDGTETKAGDYLKAQLKKLSKTP